MHVNNRDEISQVLEICSHVLKQQSQKQHLQMDLQNSGGKDI